MIMVEVATLFLGWCREWRSAAGRQGSNGYGRLDTLVYTINDMLEERGFKGRFAALTIALFDLETGMLDVCTAGSNNDPPRLRCRPGHDPPAPRAADAGGRSISFEIVETEVWVPRFPAPARPGRRPVPLY